MVDSKWVVVIHRIRRIRKQEIRRTRRRKESWIRRTRLARKIRNKYPFAADGPNERTKQKNRTEKNKKKNKNKNKRHAIDSIAQFIVLLALHSEATYYSNPLARLIFK